MIRPLHQSRPAARGFTLVELLVVTLIIMLLAGLSLSALAGALEEARIQRTHGQITKIHQVIMAKYEAFRTRRVNVSYSGNIGTTAQNRIDAIRGLIRAELPDRVSDIDDSPSDSSPPSWYVANTPSRVFSVPMFQRVQAIRNATGKTWTTEYQGAEALYLILSMPQEDGTIPIEFFKQHEIGDLDNDGMKEILDAWGNPIRFLRWPKGFESPLQPLSNGNYALIDPFDPYFMRLPNGATAASIQGKPQYNLVPLVVSAGPDGVFDISFDNAGSPVVYATMSPPNDPFYALNFGGTFDENGDGKRNDQDNIHNHLIDGVR